MQFQINFSLGIRKIICSGDIIGIGPKPEETVKGIMSLKDIIKCVRENQDNYLIKGVPNTVPNSKIRPGFIIIFHYLQVYKNSY